MTQQEFNEIAAKVKEILAADSKELSQFEEAGSLSDVTSLPGISSAGGGMKLVRVALSLLRGTDGKNIELQSDKTYVQWRYEGSENWQNLISIEDLKGDTGKTPVLKTVKVSVGDNPSGTITGTGEDKNGNPTYELSITIQKGNDGANGKEILIRKGETHIQWQYKGDAEWKDLISITDLKGDPGASPVIESVKVQNGETPSGTLTQNGKTPEGSPKYELSLVIQKGKDGQPPVFVSGTTTAVLPDDPAKVEVKSNGSTPDGSPKYILNFSIPKGRDGKNGEGSGNVLVPETTLKSGKTYLFQPNQDGSAEGTFVEYTPVDTSNFITKSVNDLANYYLKTETFTQQEVRDLVATIISSSFKKVDAKPITGEVNIIYLVPAAKTETDNIYEEWIWVDAKWEMIGTTKVDLSDYYTKEQTDGKFATIELVPTALSQLSGDAGHRTVTDEEKTKWNSKSDFDGKYESLTGTPPSLPADGGNADTVNNLTVETAVPKNAKFTDTLYDDKELRDKCNFFTGVNEVRTLASLPVDKRSIVASVSAASNISLKKGLNPGQELYIMVSNLTGGTIVQPLPNSGPFVSMNGESVNIPGGSFIEISIWCYQSEKYSIRIGEFEK